MVWLADKAEAKFFAPVICSSDCYITNFNVQVPDFALTKSCCNGNDTTISNDMLSYPKC